MQQDEKPNNVTLRRRIKQRRVQTTKSHTKHKWKIKSMWKILFRLKERKYHLNDFDKKNWL